METIEVKHGQYTVVVREAKAVDGMRRSILMVDAGKSLGETEDEALKLLHTSEFPNCMCCSDLKAGFVEPFTFEDYADLPDALTSKWSSAVLKLNPHFYGVDPKDNEKKALKPADGSGESSNGEESEK